MNKIIPLLVLFFCVVMLPGCWDRVEIEERGIVTAMGIEKASPEEEGKYAVSIQVVRTGNVNVPAAGGGGGGGGGEAVVVYSETGDTLRDALRNLARQTGRRLVYSEMSALIFGEDVSREGIGTFMDFIRRDPGPNVRTWVLVVRKSPKELLETKVPAEKVWGFGLNRMVRVFDQHSKAPVVDLLDFMRAVKLDGMEPIAVGITITGQEKPTPQEEEVSPGKKIEPAGTAVFKGYKLVGWLNKSETRGMLWVNNEVKKGTLVVDTPGQGNKSVSLDINRAGSKVSPVIENGRIIMNIKITEEGSIDEIEPGGVKLDSNKYIEQLESKKNEIIEKEVKLAVNKLQELNSDVFGFGEAIRRKYPQEWPEYKKRWDELFPAIEVTVEVDSKIRHSGMLRNPEPGKQ